MKRFTCFCCDTVLIGVWLFICSLFPIALLFLAIPSLPVLLSQKITEPVMLNGTFLLLMGWTCTRININYNVSLWVIPFTFLAIQMLIATMWTAGVIQFPINIVLFPLTASFVLSSFAPLLVYVWNCVKPRKRITTSLHYVKKRQKRDFVKQ